MAKDLGRLDNYQRLKEVIAKGYEPVEIKVVYADKAWNRKDEQEIVRLTVPKKGEQTFSVLLAVEGETDVAIVGGFSDSLLYQLWRAIGDRLKLDDKKNDGR